MKTGLYPLLTEKYGNKLRFDEELKNHTTINIGGTADLFYEANTEEDLTDFLSLVREYSIPYVIIGCGSNVIASDEGFRGVVIKNGVIDDVTAENHLLHVSSGVLLKDLVRKSEELSLSGIEFLAGIPGTVGGALYMNAGAFGKEIKDILKTATIIKKDGTVEIVDLSYFNFSYRSSILKTTGDIVLKACMKLREGVREEISLRVQEIMKLREKRHPGRKTPSAGCFFKNIPDKNSEQKISAGLLLEKSGAKKERIGDAAVFKGHANMIINDGNASFRDIEQLTDKLQKMVKKKYNIELEREVRFLHPEKGFV